MKYEEYMDDKNVKDAILAEVNDKYDKREGTLIDVIASMVAPQISNLFIQQSIDDEESFADTASYYNLARKMKERGLELYDSTNAHFKCLVLPCTLEIVTGTRLQLEGYEELLYSVVTRLENETVDGVEYAVFDIELQTAGADYNSVTSGRLLFIDNDVSGCTSINLHSLLIAGEDIEEEELARNRYFESFEDKRFGGNLSDYKSIISTMDGVGGCRVYRPDEWERETGYNIKITCISSEGRAISNELVSLIQETIYPITSDNIGIAAIGHKPKICSVKEIPICLELKLEYLDGYNFSVLNSAIEENVTILLQNLTSTWKNDDEQNSHPCLVVRVAQLISQISAVEGILDVNSIKINSSELNTNLMLDSDSIPVLKTVSEVL